jgi:hypothetical protein
MGGFHVRHKRQLSTRKLPLVVFLAGLALVAVLSGYVLERYVLGSFVATKGKAPTPPREPAASTAKTEITVPTTSLWRVQVGAFSSKDQADKLVTALKGKGFGAYISGTDPYRVLAGVTKTKEAALKLSDQLTKVGYKPYVAEFKQAAGSFTLALVDQAYVPVFRNGILSMADAVPAEAGAWDSYYLGKKTDFISSSTGVAATLANVTQKMTTTAPPKAIEALHAALSTLLQKASANAQDIKSFAEKGGKDLYVKATTSYLEVIEAYDRFLAQLPK